MILAAFFDNLWRHLHGGINFWTIFGLAGNIMFTSRFVVQWYASEKLKQSVIPKNFWHLSFLGGLINLIYALHIGAIPFILGSLLPPVIAARNLMLIARHQDPPRGRPGVPLPDEASPTRTAVERMPGHRMKQNAAPLDFPTVRAHLTGDPLLSSIVHRPGNPILYFDNNATTALDPAVVEAMMPFLTEFYGNPSSAYRFGARVSEAIDTAREQVAALLGCEAREIVFTGSGSEGNNTALASALAADRDRRHVVTTSIEHSATKNYCEALTRRGYEVTWLPVDASGRLDLDEVADAIRDETAIVSVMWANNETGVLFPVEEIARLAREKGAYFHTDAVQAVGKVSVRLNDSAIHFLSLAGHKLHAPKGVGALYIQQRTRFTPFLIGGSQENGRRGGTENVASIVALGKAAELAGVHMHEESTAVRAMRDRFEEAVLAQIPSTEVNGDRVERLPNTSSLYFPGVEGEALLILLDKAGLCASAGSACTAGSLHPSHVLTAMGFSAERARASLRFSFSRFNTTAEIDRGLSILTGAVERLRTLTPATVGG